MITFGWEIEFETNADSVVSWLHQNTGFIGDARLHGYHCDCATCGWTFPLHAQTDSSCSGEIISRPFDSMEKAREIMVAIEAAAIEMDGEPGTNAGFHVHVGNDDLPYREKVFFEFLRWEEVLLKVACGRFVENRGNNRKVTEDLYEYLRSYYSAVSERRFSLAPALEAIKTNPEQVMALYERHLSQDRHSNLNIRTRFNTWEFRLWNSTRAAWRMELWCNLSMLFVNQECINALRSTSPSVANLISVVEKTFPSSLELLKRQIEYIKNVDSGKIRLRELTIV